MENFNALKGADEVRTFPNINMPTPVVRHDRTTGKPVRMTEQHKSLFYNNSKGPKKGSIALPGLLKTRPSKISEVPAPTTSQVFTGFSANNVKLDMVDSITTFDSVAAFQSETAARKSNAAGQSIPGIGQISEVTNGAPQSVLSTRSNNNSSTKVKNDSTLDELRNYITLMDKYSLHNFLIYEGKALHETPEFQSFKRTYQFRWGAINHIIVQLEEFFQQHEVKLAIINGPRVFELSKMNLPSLEKKDLLSMVTNLEQIEMSMDVNESNQSDTQVQKTIIRVQNLLRGWIARCRYRKLQKSIGASILLQSIIRKFLYRRQATALLKDSKAKNEAIFYQSRQNLELWWKSRSLNVQEDRTRLVIYIPSISIVEYLRMDIEDYRALQNAHISNLFQLDDMDLHLVYVTPFQMSNHDKSYHEKLLSLLGISVLPKRLHFITPEQINHLPQHLSLASALWYSPAALNKLRTFTRRFASSIVVPATVTWVEKRIATYLGISVLAPESHVAETVSSRSFMKSVFMESQVNIPLGSHDIFTQDDLFVALSRLISSNVGVNRWLIRLNYDWNNESMVVFDVSKLPLVESLRTEQHRMAGEHDNVAAWFTREVQLSVRKRVLHMLKKDFVQKLRICRKDIYASWEYYLRILKQYGAVAEAEPLEKLGYIDGTCFVDPVGNVHGCKGTEVHMNEHYQIENYLYPQTLAPKSSLEGATTAVAKYLFERYHVLGYVTVSFLSLWDAHENIPRMWALGIQLGMRSFHGALGTTAVACRHTQNHTTEAIPMPLSMLPEIPDGKFCVYIPIVVHDPLKATHDDNFFKVCRMRGIAFDVKHRTGVLFFLIDSIVGGAVSILCIGSTRKKSLEIAVHTLNFIAREFGMDSETNPLRYEYLTTMLINMKKLLRHQED
mmetsp:Transcript_17270/g.28993  ORF Transcript_17270/g.28993 Transcript_17270/m.28993 type:complete len:899 (+) Transcript_17270:37-2733(+)